MINHHIQHIDVDLVMKIIFMAIPLIQETNCQLVVKEMCAKYW